MLIFQNHFSFGVRLVGATLFLSCLLACGATGNSPAISIDGSSTVYPITEAVVEEFHSVAPEVRVTIGVSGTGGGFKKFVRGETDITNASRAVKESELKLLGEAGIEFIELPVAYDGITVVVSPENDWVDYLTVAELRRIWEAAAQARITQWNQIREEWPAVPLELFGPGVDSGTYDYFTEVVCGESGASRGDFTSSEDDNVLVLGVAGNRNALGFFGYAYYEENTEKLKAVPIARTTDSRPIQPSPGTINNQSYQPLSRPVFIYVRADAAKRSEVQKLVEFYLTHAPELVREVGYVPLSAEDYGRALQRFNNRVTGPGAVQAEPQLRHPTDSGL